MRPFEVYGVAARATLHGEADVLVVSHTAKIRLRLCNFHPVDVRRYRARGRMGWPMFFSSNRTYRRSLLGRLGNRSQLRPLFRNRPSKWATYGQRPLRLELKTSRDESFQLRFSSSIAA
jgi:hypothetical protein